MFYNYKKYIFKKFIFSLSKVTVVFTSVIIIMNLFEEISFFKDNDQFILLPIYLTLLNVPSILFEIFPFIFLIGTLFFFIEIIDKEEINILKINGITNLKIIQILSLLTFIIGLLVSISSLINLASALFILPFLVSNIYKFGFIRSLKTNIQKSLGFFMPHLFFLIIYYQKSLLDVYIANLITIPLGYNSEQSLSSIYELRVWSREIYNFNIFLYFAILTLIICFLVKNLKNLKHIFSNVYVLSLVLSVVIYFIGGHNYYHHLFYLVFFIPFLLTRVHNKKYIILIYIFIFS